VSKAYNFTASGKSTYKILASNKVQYVDLATNSLVTIFADAAGATHTTFISGELAVAHRSASPLGRRIVYESCGVSEQSTLVSAVTFGQSYAAEANEYYVPLSPFARIDLMLSATGTSPPTLRPPYGGRRGLDPTPLTTTLPSSTTSPTLRRSTFPMSLYVYECITLQNATELMYPTYSMM
jgi:hypothetical protein